MTTLGWDVIVCPDCGSPLRVDFEVSDQDRTEAGELAVIIEPAIEDHVCQ